MSCFSPANKIPKMYPINGTQTFHEVKSEEATNGERKFNLPTSKIVYSFKKCRDTTFLF